jgi:hypothetical protein
MRHQDLRTTFNFNQRLWACHEMSECTIGQKEVTAAWNLVSDIKEHRLRVFENRVLRRLFRSKRNEMTGEWRKLHNEEHHSLHSLPGLITMIKSRRIWAGYVACKGRRGMHTGLSQESRKERDH